MRQSEVYQNQSRLSQQDSPTRYKREVSQIDIDFNYNGRASVHKLDGEGSQEKMFSYRRTKHDIAFAVSITDEIMQLEPMGDKLTVLKDKYHFIMIDIIKLIVQRISIFAIFNLFDTVEHNQIDNQAGI